MTNNTGKTVLLTTERLTLRAVVDADLDTLYRLYDDPEVMRHINGGVHVPRERFDQEAVPVLLATHPATGTRSYWVAEERESGDLIGWFLFIPHGAPSKDGVASADEIELGYRLFPSAWGRGYATEGSRALVHHGFTRTTTDRVMATAMTVNSGSWRVMEKCGLRYHRTFYDEPLEGVDSNEFGRVEYRLTRAQWQADQDRKAGATE